MSIPPSACVYRVNVPAIMNDIVSTSIVQIGTMPRPLGHSSALLLPGTHAATIQWEAEFEDITAWQNAVCSLDAKPGRAYVSRAMLVLEDNDGAAYTYKVGPCEGITVRLLGAARSGRSFIDVSPASLYVWFEESTD